MDIWLSLTDKKGWEINRIHAIKHLSKVIKKIKHKKKKVWKVRCSYCKKWLIRRPSRSKIYKHQFCNRFHHDLFRRNDKTVKAKKSSLHTPYLFGKSRS